MVLDQDNYSFFIYSKLSKSSLIIKNSNKYFKSYLDKCNLTDEDMMELVRGSQYKSDTPMLVKWSKLQKLHLGIIFCQIS